MIKNKFLIIYNFIFFILSLQILVNATDLRNTNEDYIQRLSQKDYFDQSTLNTEKIFIHDTSSENNKVHILFLCTGNSCRSQIAEGWTRRLANEKVEVNSAGIVAHGLNPRAVKVMQEVGIDITSQTSKVINSELIQWTNFIITVCGDADEKCPVFQKNVSKIHWPFEDPAKAEGTEDQIMSQFQNVRDDIRDKVKEFLTKHKLILRDI